MKIVYITHWIFLQYFIYWCANVTLKRWVVMILKHVIMIFYIFFILIGGTPISMDHYSLVHILQNYSGLKTTKLFFYVILFFYFWEISLLVTFSKIHVYWKWNPISRSDALVEKHHLLWRLGFWRIWWLAYGGRF